MQSAARLLRGPHPGPSCAYFAGNRVLEVKPVVRDCWKKLIIGTAEERAEPPAQIASNSFAAKAIYSLISSLSYPDEQNSSSI